MAYSKSEKFSKGDRETAAFGKALAHPARVSILRVLSRYGACLCGEIVAELPLSQATVSQHLKELKAAGLIHGRQDGPSVTYSINREALDRAERRMRKFFRKVGVGIEV